MIHPAARAHQIALADVSISATILGQGPLVVLVHGFPESGYSWRHQMGPIAEAGFTACAIDVRGYGGSSRPHPVAAYDMQSMVGDIAGVIEALSPTAPAVLIGHDWGAPIVWNAALIRPDRVRAVAGLSVPYMGPPTIPANDLYRAFFTAKGLFFYQVYFQDEGVAEAELEADVRAGLRRFWYAISGDAPDGTWPKDKRHGDTLLHRLPAPDPFPAWMSRADEDVYVAQFSQSGFRGPLNRYRNSARDFAYLQAFADRKIEQPALFIGGDRDLVLKMFPGLDWRAMMRAFIPDLRGLHLLEGCGHWTQQERPEAATALLVEWLRGL